MTDFTEIQKGDRVWVGTQRYGAKSIRTVSRVTRTQIVLYWHGNGSYLTRHRRENGRKIGGGYLSDDILKLATPSQCEEWDAKQLADKAQREQEEARQQAIENLRVHLDSLFGEYAYVGQEQYGQKAEREGKWQVSIHGLTEERVRILAAAVQSLGLHQETQAGSEGQPK